MTTLHIAKRNALHRLLPALLLLVAVPCLADDYPSGYSVVPSIVIGGIASQRSPAEDGHTIVLPAPGGEDIQTTCMTHGQLWILGQTDPRSCFKVVSSNGMLFLWLSPPLATVSDEVMYPPVMLSTKPFPNRRFSERAVSADEASEILDAVSRIRSAPDKNPTRKVTAVNVPTRRTTYYLVDGKLLSDGNETNDCATRATSIFIKDANGLNYSGELDGHPASFVQRLEGAMPDAVIVKDCGKRMALWELTPKTRTLIEYSNGYEYGP